MGRTKVEEGSGTGSGAIARFTAAAVTASVVATELMGELMFVVIRWGFLSCVSRPGRLTKTSFGVVAKFFRST